MNFIKQNHIVPRANDKVIEVGKHRFPETNKFSIAQTMSLSASDTLIPHKQQTQPKYVSAHSVSVNHVQVILPEQQFTENLPDHLPQNGSYIIEPQPGNVTSWPPPRLTHAQNGVVQFPNETDTPILIPKTTNFVRIRPVYTDPPIPPLNEPDDLTNMHKLLKEAKKPEDYLSLISIDPHNQLTQSQKEQVQSILRKYHTVFDDDLSNGYNNASGKCFADFNFADNTRPPGNKGYYPSYTYKENLVIQAIADSYEDQGVLVNPEELGISVKHISPLLLVLKPSATKKPARDRTVKDYRLVGAFNALNDKIKTQPELRREPDHLLNFATTCKFLFQTDVCNSFYQQWMAKNKWPYLGVQTPFKGVRLLTRSSMGVKNMTERNNSLLALILYEMIVSKKGAQKYDDILTGGNTFTDALQNFELLLNICQRNNMKLAPHKTICCPQRATIIGWEWESGQIHPSSHQKMTLSEVTASSIRTVKDLRSYIGLYRVFFKSHPGQALTLHPLETECAGKNTKDPILWTPELHKQFDKSKADIENIRPRSIPKSSDTLIISKDAALAKPAIGMMLWAIRGSEWHFCETFSFIVNATLSNWYACELEGYADGCAGKKWQHHILESDNESVILTDNKSCYLAFQMMKKGKLSESPRLNKFLSGLSALPIRLELTSGKLGMILGTDTISRNPSVCDNPEACQTCIFVTRDIVSADIRQSSVSDIISGKEKPPFINIQAIKQFQREDKDTSRAIQYILGGTQPQRNDTKCRTVKHYLQFCKVNKEGILYKPQTTENLSVLQLPAIPVDYGKSILTAQHFKLNHPTLGQHEQVVKRTMFLPRSSQIINKIIKTCPLCSAATPLPAKQPVFSSNTIPTCPASNLAGDVMKWSGDNILVITDDLSGFVMSAFVKSEKKDDLLTGVLTLILPIKIGPHTILRTDSASGMKALKNEKSLTDKGISIELGFEKNKNSLAICDRAQQLLQEEIRKLDTSGSKISPKTLAEATFYVNSRLKSSRMNLSPKDILFRRDQFTGKPINVKDKVISSSLVDNRLKNHPQSVKSKALHLEPPVKATVKRGDIVFLHGDGTKHTIKDMYLVSAPAERKDSVYVQKMAHPFDSKTATIRPTKYQVSLYQVVKAPFLYDTTDTSSSDDSFSDESCLGG